jgi:tetratricopeptide (TPR) repeat protein
MNKPPDKPVFTIMKNRPLFMCILAAIFILVLSAAASAIGNPAASPTVPPSSIRSGLIRSPNPIDTSGNLVITGHVGGGMHFRGVVPYNAVSDFGGPLYSTSLDSFLRRSAGSTGFGRYTGRFTPYYSHTGTVTAMRPGRSVVVTPPTAEIGRRTAEEYDLQGLLSTGRLTAEQDQPLFDSGILVSDIELDSRRQQSYGQTLLDRRPYGRSALGQLRPMSMTLQELEKIISSEQRAYQPEDEESTAVRHPADYRQQTRESDTQRFGQQLQIIDDGIAELKKDAIGQQRPSSPLSMELLDEDAGRRFEVQTPHEQADDYEQADEDEQLDVYEQMMRQIEDLERGYEQLFADREIKEIEDGERQIDRQQRRSVEDAILRETEDEDLIAFVDRPQEDSQKKFSPKGLPQTDLSAGPKAILGKHSTFVAFSRDKFNEHVRAAEAYLKRGKYYRAADAYTLASIYKASDPLVYAGKSYALFAAGEYMSSALFLSRAIEIFPEYVRFDIDIVAMIGDRDKIESRIVDIEHWLERSDVGELHFLLGYVYYRIGRLEPAKEAIDAAYERMPGSPAVAILKKVIDQAGQ